MTPSASAASAPSAAGRGASLALASAAAFATTGILSQFAFDAGANIVSLLSGRYLLCAAILWSAVALLRLGVPARRDALLVLGLGAGLISIQSCLFFHSLQRIPPGLADMLMFIYPALVTAGAILLRREQLSRRRVAALALALSGVAVVLLAGGSASIDVIGVLFALSAAVGYATYLLLTEGIVQRSHPVALTALMTTGAGTAYLVAGLFGAGGGLRLDLPAHAWLVTIAITLLGTIVPFVGFAAATRHVGASTASIIATAQVPCTAILAALLLGQSPATVQVIGAALVLSAVGALQVRPVPARWRRRLLAPSRMVRGRLERAAPERRPDRGRPVRRAARRVRRPLQRTRS